jgi:hypothetical protein
MHSGEDVYVLFCLWKYSMECVEFVGKFWKYSQNNLDLSPCNIHILGYLNKHLKDSNSSQMLKYSNLYYQHITEFCSKHNECLVTEYLMLFGDFV